LRDVTAHLLHDVPAAITDATPGAVLMARATVISASVAKKALPVTTLQELIDLIKKDPSKLSNGHGGVGATSHLRCLLFTSLIGARSPMIPYRGSGPALQDLVAGNHDFMCDQIPHTVRHVQGVAIKALDDPGVRTRLDQRGAGRMHSGPSSIPR
jgi:tripartite-type tricarboxylate transporter receptor subunit TctC